MTLNSWFSCPTSWVLGLQVSSTMPSCRQAHSNSASWTTSLTLESFFFFLILIFLPDYHRRQLLAHHPIWKSKLRLFILFSICLMWKGLNNEWSSHLTPGAVVCSCIVRRSFCFCLHVKRISCWCHRREEVLVLAVCFQYSIVTLSMYCSFFIGWANLYLNRLD